MGSITTTFAYDGDGKRVKKAESNGSTVTTTVYIGNYLEKVFVNSTLTDTVKYYYAGGKRIAMRRAPTGGAETLSYMFSDHLGGTSVVLNASTGTTSTISFYPFGNTRSGTVPTDYQYTGQKLDGTTGLMYYGARYYDSGIGRFVSPDTVIPNLGNPQDLNRYSYVRNRPLTYRDPSGNLPDEANKAILGIPIGIVQGAADAVAAVVDLGRAVVKSATGDQQQWEANRQLASAVLNHPGDVAGAAWEGFKEPFEQAWEQEEYGQAVGRGIFEAGSAVLGGTGVVRQGLKLTKAARVAKGADAVGTAVRAFANEKLLMKHFADHGAEFGYKNADEYLRGAQRLTEGGKGTLTHSRKGGDKLFYNPNANEFAVLADDGKTIRTFFKPTDGYDYWVRVTAGGD